MISRITDQIYIGDQNDAVNEELYKIYKFDSIINVNDRELKEELDLVKKYDVGYVIFGHPQGDKGLQAAGYLWGCVAHEEKVLIHCESGIDRAPFVVAQYLAKKNHIPLHKAYNIVKYFRPQIFVHLEWG